MTAVCEELVAQNGLDLDAIDLFIPHQANLRIMGSENEKSRPGAGRSVISSHSSDMVSSRRQDC